MICLRCGKCCLHLDIFVINPLSILADGWIDPEDQKAMIFKPAGEKCPRLAFGLEDAVCVMSRNLHHDDTKITKNP
ncbi:MAG TPA: hypothetical protein PKV33_09280 [Methanothrix sp.]|nr:hypothetical protein [Methanothrix sp.]